MDPLPRLDGAPRRRWIGAVLAAATLAVGWPLLLPWIYDTHDGHYAMYNAAQMYAALADGQLPVRWLPDLFGGRGLPHFNYYHPLSFYLAALLQATGLGPVAAVKGVTLLGLLSAAAAAWLWLAEIVPPRAAAAGAAAYLLAPFMAVEVHVKGDPPAVWAVAFVPLVLWAARRAAGAARWGVTLLALTSAGLVLSHAVTAMLVLPAAAAWLLVLARRDVAAYGRVAAGAGWGALLSAFHWLPALAERSLVHVDSPLGILFFDFREHFVAAWQWLSPSWGYHGSFAGTPDDMAFQVGPVHLAALLAGAAAWRFAAGAERRAATWGLALAAMALLGTLQITRPLWEALPPLAYVQFPWRLLVLVQVAAALLAAVALHHRPRLLLPAAAATPSVVALAFAALEQNRWYLLLGLYHAGAGAMIWGVWAARGRRARQAATALVALLVATALPWTAVPLHSAWRGEPVVIPLTDADLQPERVRLGVRRTTARDDYLPRSVADIPPRDAQQEYLPPASATPPENLEVLAGSLHVETLWRRSAGLWFVYRSETAARAVLNLHDFAGMTATLQDPYTLESQRLPHAVDASGRIVLELPQGRHAVQVHLRRTPPRRAGETLSLAGLVMLLLVPGLRRWRKP